MSAMKRELERIAEVILAGDYSDVFRELKHLEAMGSTITDLALVIDTAKAMAPLCACGNDYFEGIKKNGN